MGIAIFVAIFGPLFVMFFFMLAGEDWKAWQAMQSARRMADNRMNARLLRLDI
jgi:hypothetical protein